MIGAHCFLLFIPVLLLSQQTFTCSKSPIVTLVQSNMFKVNNKDTVTDLVLMFFIANFEHILHLFIVFL